MFKRIMTPVDLGHLDRIRRALEVTASEARHHDAPVTYVSVAPNTPGPQGHNPEEFRAKLKAFAEEQSRAHGIEATAHAIISHDPTIDVDDKLLEAVEETGADLVVMSSHRPDLEDYLLGPNAARVVRHAATSVLVVRPKPA